MFPRDECICGHVIIVPLPLPRYPPDDPLAFEKLPRLASLDIKEEMEEEVKNAHHALEWASFSLGIIVGEFKDLVDKTIDFWNDRCKEIRLPCETSKKATDALEAQMKMAATLR